MKPRCIRRFISVSYLPQVNLYSDPPRPGHLLQSGLTRDSSPVTALDFTRPQRAAFSSAPLQPNGHANDQRSSSATRSPDPPVGEQLAKIIYSQADRFLRQMQSFKDLLKSNRLLPSDQMKVRTTPRFKSIRRMSSSSRL
ncbi:AT-hook-containing transcription factor [Liparis tanakae]|uniref:AT-hook-containing transcription factor n=1 Tax=Liparis tanakae TaxID=230148 RepID=A0A4Z2EAT4_9TELE|nr:AT-hook-containing transcription factor [Liparis tanakae]